MNYYIFIDESGSLNNLNKNYFLVSLFILDENNYSKIKNYSKRNLKKLKVVNKVSMKNELKVHDFKLNNKLEFLYKLCESLLDTSFSCASYIDNKNINPKFLNDKNATYNFMVKLAIERAYDLGIIQKNSKLIIKADNRNIKINYKGSIETYLRTQLIVERDIFKEIKLEFLDSKSNWGVQIADFFSFYNFSIINNKIINKHQKPYIRKIY